MEKNVNLVQEILQKVKVPEKYQESFKKFLLLFNLPHVVKFIITDRIGGKTTSKILEILAKIMLAIEKKQKLPNFIWLRRDWNESVQKVMENFKKIINAFCSQYWQGKKIKGKDFEIKWEAKTEEKNNWKTIYRGVFYKSEQLIYFYDLYDDEGSRGSHFGSPQEIIFDEFMPTHPSKYLSDKSTNKGEEEGLTEEIMFSEMWSGAWRDEITKLCFLGNPYDRFNYTIQKNWSKELEKWATKYQENKPATFIIKITKKLTDGDELIYLEKFPERRTELSKFDSRDKAVWDKKFFAPLSSLNIVKLGNSNYTAVETYFNDIVLVRTKRGNKEVFAHHSELKEGIINKSLLAIVFNNEEHLAAALQGRVSIKLKRAKDIAYRWTKQLSNKELGFNDFFSRNKVLEFISKNNIPYVQQNPWGIKKSKNNFIKTGN